MNERTKGPFHSPSGCADLDQVLRTLDPEQRAIVDIVVVSTPPHDRAVVETVARAVARGARAGGGQ